MGVYCFGYLIYEADDGQFLVAWVDTEVSNMEQRVGAGWLQLELSQAFTVDILNYEYHVSF